MTSEAEINPLLAQRWSPRAFAEREVALDVLQQLFEAARWAPSCYNDQPWSFVIGRRGHGDGYQAILDTLVPFNQQWASTAPVLIIAICREEFSHNGKPNRHAWYDLGLAMGNLLVEATALGLHAHQMAGFDPDAAAQSLDIPAPHSAVSATALGYLGSSDRLPDDMEDKAPGERERKLSDEFVFEARFGASLK